MADLNLGQLLRLRGVVEAATESVSIDGAAAPALTEGYGRVRALVRGSLDGYRELIAEFEELFPEIDLAEVQSHPVAVDRARRALAAEANRAKALLDQLGGWLQGAIDELTLDQKLQLEAEERVKQERRKPPGFTSS